MAAEVPDALLDAIEDDVTPDDRMVIVHTSGSTSAPKGVIHQHGPLLGHLDALQRDPRVLHAACVLFSNSPMFWIGGLAYNIVGRLGCGATLLCSAATDPVEALDFIERERPELTNGYAASIAALVAHPSFAGRDFSSIRSGNLHPLLPAAIRPADVELRHNMLGTTETGSVCLMSGDETDQPEHRRGSFGMPVPGLTPRVVDPETLADVPVGAVGELWFRGPSLMEGYYGRERFEIFTADGWYRTGDLFHVDEDGFFYFHGRRGSMIKTAGANVSPLEVEAALSDATGGLAVMVLGVPDPERDQVVAAVILAEPDTAPDLDARAHRAAGAAVGVQGAATVPGARTRRPPDALERQARPARDRGALRMSGERLTVPGLVRRWADEQPDRDFVVTDDDALTYGELERRSAALACALRRSRGGQRNACRCADDQRHRVAGGGVRRQSRCGATVVPLSTFLRPPELAAQLRTAGVEHLVLQGEFLGRDYVADLMAISPESGHRRGAHGRCGAAAPDDHRVGGARRRAPTCRRGPSSSRAGRLRPAGRRSRDRVHVRQSRHPEGCDPHPRRRARGHRVRARRAPAHRRRPPLHPDAVLLGGRLRYRAALRARSSGATLLTEARPDPAHLAVPRTQPGHAVPRLARPGRRTRA